MRSILFLLRLGLIAGLLAVILPAGVSARSRHPQSRPLIVVLDPGHGGWETGAADPTDTLAEKTVALEIALSTATTLRQMGYTVYLTRTRDQQVNTPPRDWNGDGKIDHIDEYDARTIFANRHHADVFVSIHLDGSTDPTRHGTHGFYCPDRPFWQKSKTLATILTASVTSALRRTGYPDTDNGIMTDVADIVPQSRADYPWFLVLGPSRPHWLTGTAMPGALIETLYLTNARDAAEVRRPSIIAAIGRGYADGIRQYFGGHTHS